jgi:hypothetical protein
MKSRTLTALLIALTSYTTTLAATATKTVSPRSRQDVMVPLRFQPNQGQTDPQVRFEALGAGYGIFLTSSDVVLALHRNQKHSALRLSFEGALPTLPRAEGSLPSHTNYLIGNDPRQWRTDIPNFNRVRYSGVYRGVDAVFYGKQHRLEYDVVVAPGATLKKVALRFGGARSVALSRTGDLLIRLDSGTLLQHRPIAYQVTKSGRQRVHVSYELRSGHRVAFKVGAYDRRRELIIDPVLSYSTYFGGASDAFDNTESGESIAVDSSGHAYVTGCTTANDYPLKNPQQPTFTSGTTQAYVTKFAANGSGLIYSTFLGGITGTTCGRGIAVDRFNQAYVAGSTTPSSFGRLIGPADGANVFAAKLNASGNALLYAARFGGSSSASIGGVALDSSGHLYMTGATDSSDFPTTPGAFMTVPGSNSEISGWVAKLNPSGTAFTYSTYLGGNVDTQGHGIAIDAGLNAYVTGFTWANGFPTTAGAFQTTFPTKNVPCGICRVGSAFVTKLNPSGSALAYSTYLGGNNADSGNGIAVDSQGRAYVTGSTGSTNFPTTSGAFQRSNHGNLDVFVTRLNASGSALSYSTLVGGSNAEIGYSIGVNSLGHAHVTGYTQSTHFPVKNAIQSTLHGGSDAFAIKLWATGGGFHYSTYLGGTGDDVGRALRLDGNGRAYLTGNTASTNFPTTTGAYHRTKRGSTDGFVTKISP